MAPLLTTVADLPLTCLTISQPFADLIADGEKWVENRTWSDPFRGRIGIHAGKRSQYLTKKKLAERDTGCIIAVGYILAWSSLRRFNSIENPERKFVNNSAVTVADVLEHEHTEGPYCIVLVDVQRIQPVPARGQQKLWVYDGH